jgi:hypothetical protein
MQTPLDPLEERVLGRIPWEIAVAAALLGLGACLLLDIPTGLFVLAGGLISAASFVGMKKSLTLVLLKEKRKAIRSGMFLFGLRILLILLVFSTIILISPRRLLAFAAGFSMVVPVFLIEAMRAIFRTKPWNS